MSLNFDNAMYKTITIFQKNPNVMEWETIPLNSKGCMV